MNQTRTIRYLLIALLTATAACQSKPPPGPPPSGVIEEGLVTATATVKKVDLKTRKVTLAAADGQTFTVTAGEQVRNLAQVKAGDQVGVTYYESIAYAVRRPGEATPGVVVAEDAARAAPGSRPGAAGARVVTVTSTITAVDKKAGTATIQPPEGGEPMVVKVRDRNALERVAKGDLVEITMTEAIAVAVEPPAK